MPYEDIQVVTQIASLALFMGIMIAAYIYAFRRSNKAKFVEASAMPLRDDAPPADWDKQ
ncbi:Cbb3-type cytochrome oxidase component [Hyphomicrobium denitrificans ATCC 51888]|uniref:Cbb3-type cytochrome oxidase component n=1 Tax=Hyphomicrobium denitrificans (strain ATCC 51888 / DSM 1869 / NCIMB 11706 / TK 0415) TaxID=582899 RepID=D8JPW5_HYPDA|nr:cbb3-type cytochrome c oxidase subunit 3 [Hyphomicrobium denitrificans]ADJ23849.1 Cbb3-type cytochrome oxidase component [Hyphomicrobium denitrificans ATCC 51888]